MATPSAYCNVNLERHGNSKTTMIIIMANTMIIMYTCYETEENKIYKVIVDDVMPQHNNGIRHLAKPCTQRHVRLNSTQLDVELS